MSNTFLPQGYEATTQSKKRYINLSKLPEGEHRFRILSKCIAGWLDWKDNKPHRFRIEEKPNAAFDPLKPIKSFWAFLVWDYSSNDIYIMEITQNGVKKSLEELVTNEDWGDPMGYDIKIKKEGAGKDTIYSVIPVPHKPVNSSIKDALSATKVRLEALYDGTDPWTDLAINKGTGEIKNNSAILSDEQINVLHMLSEKIEDQEFLLNVEEFFECTSLAHLSPKHFDRAVRMLQKKIKGASNEDVA